MCSINESYYSEYIKPVYEDIDGCISTLKQVPDGEVWTLDQIKDTKHRMLLEDRDWTVVENLPLHEDIKRNGAYRDVYIQNYQESIVNLAQSGIKVIGYNFTPVYYKLRTHFNFSYDDKYAFSHFDPVAFAVFDLFILNRPLAEKDYNGYQIHKAHILNNRLTELHKIELTNNIFHGFSSIINNSLEELLSQIFAYSNVSNEDLRHNFEYFNSQIIPLANDLGVHLHCSADNQCSNLFGLPGSPLKC